MTLTVVDAETGDLLVGGKRVFAIGLSDPPPVDGVAPGGGNGWAEIARAGVSFVRNYTVWTNAGAAEQVSSVLQELDAASVTACRCGWRLPASITTCRRSRC
jgi:hypothetical protein